MSDVVIFHPVGNGDLALRPGERPDEALARLEQDPDTALLDRRDDHTNATAGPIPGTIDTLRELGHTVTRVVLFVTQQTPPHPSDTAPWSPLLTQAVAKLDSLNHDNHPIDVSTVTVTNFSIQAFAKRASSAATECSNQIVIPIGSGAKAAFLGVLIGVIRSGALPLVLPVGRPELVDQSAQSLSVTVDLNPIRWLVRRRMWASIAALPTAPQAVRDAARALDRFERHEADDPSTRGEDEVARELARAVSLWAVDEPLWLTNLSRIIEMLTNDVIEQLLPQQRAAVTKQIASWKESRVIGRSGAARDDAQLCHLMALHHKQDWARWRTKPEPLQAWVDKFADIPQARHARHGKFPEEGQQVRRADTRANRALAALANGTTPVIEGRTGDHLSEHARAVLDAGLPDSPLPGARLAVRLAGKRNSDGAINPAIESDHLVRDTSAVLSLPVLVFASDETRVDERDVVIDPHRTDIACSQALEALRAHITQLESKHACRITTIALYLNQGTKVMCFATLRAALSVAAELGAEIELYDVADAGSGETQVHELPRGIAETVTRKALPADQVRSLLRSSIAQMQFAQAQRLAALLEDREMAEDVAALSNMMLRPLANVTSDDIASRISAIAPAVNALIEFRHLIGDRETVARLATLLSAAVATNEGGSRDEGWDDTSGALASLWQARNGAFHPKRFTFPRDLSKECLLDLAAHLDVDIEPNAVPWDTAISRRKELLKRLEATVRT